MLQHHLPHFIANIASLARHAGAICYAARQAAVGVIYQLETPRDAFRVALRQRRGGRHRQLRPGGRYPGRADPLLIHYHIFKNAGTSFEWALKQTFGDQFRQFDLPRADGVVTARGIARLARREPQLVAISSHQAMPPAPRIIGRKVLTSILLRDPIARIGSIYQFERGQQVDTLGATKAKELDFKSYVNWRLETSPSMFCNFQVHFCSATKNRSIDCGRQDLEAAIIRLDAIDIVGTVRRYDEYLALAQSVLGEYTEVTLPLRSAHRNRSRPGVVMSEADILSRLISELGSDLTQELIQRNELDMYLHQVADALLSRRLAERSVVNALRDSYACSKEPA